MNNSEITIQDALEYVDNFCFIKLYYNDELIYDDDVGVGFYIEQRDNLKKFEKLQKLVYHIEIEIVEFHHSIIKIWGEPLEELWNK